MPCVELPWNAVWPLRCLFHGGSIRSQRGSLLEVPSSARQNYGRSRYTNGNELISIGNFINNFFALAATFCCTHHK